jgi:hypothetical protein
VTVTKSNKTYTDTQAFTVTIYAAAPSVTAPPTTTRQDSRSDGAITPIGATATGGSGSFTWSATGLPAGITISTAGVISGTPTTNTTGTTVTVKATDTVTGASDTQTFTWKVTS